MSEGWDVGLEGSGSREGEEGSGRTPGGVVGTPRTKRCRWGLEREPTPGPRKSRTVSEGT